MGIGLTCRPLLVTQSLLYVYNILQMYMKLIISYINFVTTYSITTIRNSFYGTLDVRKCTRARLNINLVKLSITLFFSDLQMQLKH